MSRDQLPRDILPRRPDRQWALECLKPYDLTEVDFDRELQRLTKRFRTMPSAADVVHSLFIRLEGEAVKKGEWGQASQIGHRHAWRLFQIGDRHHHVLRGAHTYELQSFTDSGVIKEVRISVAENACPTCKALSGRIYTLAEFLQVQPLPVANCEGDRVSGQKEAWCRCMFDPILEE